MLNLIFTECKIQLFMTDLYKCWHCSNIVTSGWKQSIEFNKEKIKKTKTLSSSDS